MSKAVPLTMTRAVCTLALALLCSTAGCKVYDATKLQRVPMAQSTQAGGSRSAAPVRDIEPPARCADCVMDAGVATAADASNGSAQAGSSAPKTAGDSDASDGIGDAPVADGGSNDGLAAGSGGASAAADSGVTAALGGGEGGAAAGSGGVVAGGAGPDSAGASTSAPAAGCPADVSDAAGLLACAGAQLRHRYRFDGSGSAVADSVGTADGMSFGGQNAVQANGELALTGDAVRGYFDGGYVALPAAAWSGLRDATFEAWLVWRGAGPTGLADWQRIFDFGTQQTNADGGRYLFLATGADGRGFRVAYSLEGPGTPEVSINAALRTAQNTVLHVAVVVSADPAQLSLFSAGSRQGSVPLPGLLSDVTPQNLWLGRSNFDADPELCGSLLEFRIYDAALSVEALRASEEAGPDYDFAR